MLIGDETRTQYVANGKSFDFYLMLTERGPLWIASQFIEFA